MKQATKFCRCIKGVRKTLKARKGSTKEQGAIAVCVKSILQTRGRTLKKFKCGKKARLITQKKKRGGGVLTMPRLRQLRAKTATLTSREDLRTIAKSVAAESTDEGIKRMFDGFVRDLDEKDMDVMNIRREMLDELDLLIRGPFMEQ